jgi:hypothetical protein
MTLSRVLDDNDGLASAGDSTTILPVEFLTEQLDGAVLSLMEKGKTEAHGLRILEDDPLQMDPAEDEDSTDETKSEINLGFPYTTIETSPVLVILPVTCPLPLGFTAPTGLDITSEPEVNSNKFGTEYELLQDWSKSVNWLLTNKKGRCLSEPNTIFKTGQIMYPAEGRYPTVRNLTMTVTTLSPYEKSFKNNHDMLLHDMNSIVKTNHTDDTDSPQNGLPSSELKLAADAMKDIALELNSGNTKKSKKETQEQANAQEKLATTRLLFANSVMDASGNVVNIQLPTLQKEFVDACQQTKRDDQQQKLYESFAVFTRQKRAGEHYRDKSFMVTGHLFDRAFTTAIVNAKYMTHPVTEDETALRTRICPIHLLSPRVKSYE